MPPTQDLVLGVQQRYQFSNIHGYPNNPPGTPIVFQNGRFQVGDDVHAVAQLAMEAAGDVVSTSDTETGDRFIDDLFDYLDRTFRFQFGSHRQRRSYVSTLIVEFGFSFEEKIPALTFIHNLVNQTRRSRSTLFGLRRLSFAGDPPQTVATMPGQSHVALIEEAEFIIERRAGSSLDTNTYFCTAPFRTMEHVGCLETIERFLASAPT
jgi:hypothetical protein